MPAIFTVKCPECRTTLKSSRPIPAGKLLTCPKCDVLFAAPKPVVLDAEVIEEVEVVEDVDVVEYVEVLDDAGALEVLPSDRIRFQYRRSSLEGRALCFATLGLKPGNREHQGRPAI